MYSDNAGEGGEGPSAGGTKDGKYLEEEQERAERREEGEPEPEPEPAARARDSSRPATPSLAIASEPFQQQTESCAGGRGRSAAGAVAVWRLEQPESSADHSQPQEPRQGELRAG
ncbi:uncharacterized protein TrAFT101_002205 [Trichoderma asperellum]|uniref:uncharacterized protein n=1 Tax=Trichoderma asperellum TaxID=101201 RepID=UPI0033177CFA|nr:hypothetical protein TrAFT101_002205 [Trichoderma asperellum]